MIVTESQRCDRVTELSCHTESHMLQSQHMTEKLANGHEDYGR